MFEKLKANMFFERFLKRPNINKAYAMVKETDSWYDTIKKVHESLDMIRKEPHEILEIKSEDNLKLKAVYYPNTKKSNTTVICVHGYTSHAEREWAFPGLFYLSLGYNVLIPYQRAHGLSEGKYIAFGAMEPFDMLGWVKLVNKMNPNGKIIIHGLSMGGGIVLNLSKYKMENVKGLIVDAPNVSIESFFVNVTKEIFKTNPEQIATFAIARFEKEFGCKIKDFESVQIVSESQYPMLLSAGSNENLEELFETIKKTNPKETDIIVLPGCNHGNGMYKQTELYQSKIKEFLANIDSF